MPERYDFEAAVRYWGSERLRHRDELSAVLSLSEPREVNLAYHAWESHLVVESLGRLRGRRVVDIACGVGRLTLPLARAGARVLALDSAPGMLAHCQRHLRAAGLARRVELALGPAWAIPVPDGSLDGAVCVGLLEHLPPTQQVRVLAEIRRALRRGGRMATVFNNPHSALLRAPADNRFRQGHQLPNGYYCALVDRSRLLRLLGRHFEVRPVGNNTLYSVLRAAFRSAAPRSHDAPLRRRALRVATELDLRLRFLGPLDELLTDHTFYCAVKRR
ncbi:MAG TPA: class I SAM-dependent methyltransferase [Candidatus Saccharimonadales bacterium]|nr:class I SAM-dependent methyltransferase [Candidatus Saccharimonadales bacterium]